MNKFARGSEWRKWDLHIHTKDTNKNDQFVSSDYNTFCKTLFKKALENEIQAIGITDYFSIANYNKVIEYKKNINSNEKFTPEEKERINNIFILPNVELRMLPVTDSGSLINIHCIFNPDYVQNLNNDFFNTLKYTSHSQDLLMNYQGMVQLGKQVDNTIDDDVVAYKKGVDNFVVSHNDLKKILLNNNNLRENVIIVVSNSSRDGNSGLQKHYNLFENDAESSLDDVRRSIYHLSDCLFSSNESDIKYFSGKGVDSSQEVIRKCGSLKSCIHGSDAHTEEKLFNPDLNRYCWIKADLTFHGLKQIIYEPEARTKIHQANPAFYFEKAPLTEIIVNENVDVFEDEKDNVTFEKNMIPLNNSLVSIIGGRGTGKSILIDYIAAGLGQNVKNKNYTKSDKITIKRQTSLKDEATSFVISDSPNVQFMYISQSEIKSIVVNSQEFTKNIRETIGVIDNYTISRDYIEKADKYINEYFGVIKILEAGNTNSQQKKEAIEKEIKRYNDFIANITSKENRQKLENYQKHLNLLTDRMAFFEKLQNQKNLIEQFQFETNNNIQQLNITLSKYNCDLKITPMDSNTTIKDISQTVLPKIKEFITSVENEILGTKKTFEGYSGDLATLLNDVTLYQKKVTEFQEQKKILEENEKKFETIKQNYFKELGAEIYSSIYEYKQRIESQWLKFKNGSDDYSAEQKQLLLDILGDDNLNVVVDINFDKEKMYQLLMHKLDGRSWNPVKLEETLKINDLEGYINFIKQTSESNAFNETVNPISMNILNIFFRKYNEFITHNIMVTSQGKNIIKLSHGQQGTIYLRLKLAANLFSKTIIYDQPEDDLDNDFIMSDLVSIFRNIKKYRQVIIVSHNANLVVNADSEQVIIAQNDEGLLKYTSGALENPEINKQICRILEGGKTAFLKREKKYGFKLN